MARKTWAERKAAKLAKLQAAQQAAHDTPPAAAAPVYMSGPPKAPVDTKVENLDTEPEAAQLANGSTPDTDE